MTLLSGIPRFGDRSRISLAMRAAALFEIMGAIASELLLLGGLIQPAPAQDARWYQLSEQVVQLQEKGKSAEAIPPAQEAVRVAEATYGPQDRRLGLSLNVLGILFEEVEKFADADRMLRRALVVMTRASGGSA